MTERTETTFVGDLEGLQSQVNILDRIQPEFHRQEVSKVFRRGWLLIANVADIPEPNTYLARQVPTLNTCLIIARSGDGEIRAFHNMCRHRANQLVPEGAGRAKMFVCGFHGWSYHNDGRVAVITDRSQFNNID
tara:strand:- start:946 stop:1347 length:402 start_codon:yes stop_codon:yes gene_type:complete